MIKTKKIIATISIIGIALGFILLYPEKFGICNDVYIAADGYVGCFDVIKEEIGGIIMLFSIILFTVFLPLSFFNDKIFNAWFKFTKVYLPVSLFLVSISSPYDRGVLESPSGGMWLLFFSLGFFPIVSIFIVLYNRNKKDLPIHKQNKINKNIRK